MSALDTPRFDRGDRVRVEEAALRWNIGRCGKVVAYAGWGPPWSVRVRMDNGSITLWPERCLVAAPS